MNVLVGAYDYDEIAHPVRFADSVLRTSVLYRV